ncbi:MAG: multiheme c-type cytochrome [Planctomycetota bacterium]
MRAENSDLRIPFGILALLLIAAGLLAQWEISTQPEGLKSIAEPTIQPVTYQEPVPRFSQRSAGGPTFNPNGAIPSTSNQPITQPTGNRKASRYPLLDSPTPRQPTRDPDNQFQPDPSNQSSWIQSHRPSHSTGPDRQELKQALERLKQYQAAANDPEQRRELGLSDDDVQLLQNLPEICTTETEGLNLEDVVPAQARIEERARYDEQVVQASAQFRWPDNTPAIELDPEAKPQILARPRQMLDRNLEKVVGRKIGSSGIREDWIPHSVDVPPEAWGDGKEDPHLKIYSRTAFPSAKDCAQCHKQIYEEWASSSHAYASISPMFHKFENTINRLAQGTIGYFCLRCHAPVATTMGLRRDQAIWDGPRVFREGVTCVACHRVSVPYTKADGERRIEPGDLFAPVYGSGDGRGVEIANKYNKFFKIKKNRNDKNPGQAIHSRSIQFEELSKSSFCMSCHQVAVKPGIKLEVVWDQYRASPAYRDGVTCQDCHMGKVPGVDAGYSVGPGAVVDNKVINAEKKHSNHLFYGPGYSIAHPGVFPDTIEADRWTVNQWLEFDWRAGWGTDEFEDAIADGNYNYYFPPTWQNIDDRYDAREIVDANLKKLEYKRDIRRQLLENGSKLDGPFFSRDPAIGKELVVRYCISNINPGHNMPSGSLGAQPQIWVNVVLIGPTGQRLWESGYLDSHGDLCDNHSLDVLARTYPLDTQLINFQTKFLTTNVKGTDREMYLPVNFDFDQLPFLRPAPQPVTVQNHPPFIRMEGHSLPPLGSRNIKYVVPARLMQIPGTYRLSIRMRSRAEPIYFMRFCDSTEEMKRSMNEWICDFHVSTVAFEVD